MLYLKELKPLVIFDYLKEASLFEKQLLNSPLGWEEMFLLKLFYTIYTIFWYIILFLFYYQ